MNKKGLAFLLILFAILTLFVVGGGYYLYKQTFIPGPDPLMSTSNWKTYRNEQYGLEIKIPSDWVQSRYSYPDSAFLLPLQLEQRGERNEIGEFEKSYIVAYFLIGDEIPVRGYNDWLLENYRNDIELPSGSWRTYTASSIEGDLITYSRVHNGVTYNFDAHVEDEDLLRNILSTFKFIESFDTSTWKTYRNEQYGFEVKYPSTYNVNTGLTRDRRTYPIFVNTKYNTDVPSLIGLSLEYDPVFSEGFKRQSTFFNRQYEKDGLIQIFFISDDGRKIYATCNLTAPTDEENNTVFNICNQILSTFKFISPK